MFAISTWFVYALGVHTFMKTSCKQSHFESSVSNRKTSKMSTKAGATTKILRRMPHYIKNF